MSGFSFGQPQPFKFDLGASDFGGDAFYNTPSNFGYAWQQVLNQLGGNPSGNYYKFLQNWAPQARAQLGVATAANPNLRIQDFFNSYAPGLSAQYGLLSPQDRGENSRLAGRPRFLG